MFSNGSSTENCGVCEQNSEMGFYLLSMWICLSCERKMVELNVEDPSYTWYIERLRGSKMNNRMLLH
ncbi:sigma factor G inhibitor Gin [Natribacillus halophilus]|nr:sigma factor G inhibitor Gin [Natribacillus halophilus]